MTRFLKRWGAVGGAGLIGSLVTLLGIYVPAMARHDLSVTDAASKETHQSNGIAAEMVWRTSHEKRAEEVIGEVRGRLGVLERGQTAMLRWMERASIALHISPPADPATIRIGPLSPSGIFAAESPPEKAR